MAEVNPALNQLEDQLKWYSGKSAWNKQQFQRLKVAEIIAAALIPFFAGYTDLVFLTGFLGVIIVVLEGLQGLYQFHDNWTSYRSTSEALKHEKYLWLAKSGPYKDATDPDALLAERVEATISREYAKWVEVREKAGKEEKKGEG